jgi:hypothetical protein
LINEESKDGAVPEPGTKEAERVKKAGEEIWKRKYEVVQNLIDLPCAIHYASKYKYFSTELVYLLSSITSLMASYTLWPKMK